MYLAVLLKVEVKALQEANWVKKQRERKRKKRIVQGGSLTIQEGEDIIQSTIIEAQIQQEVGGLEVKQRRCSLCNNFRHNARIYARYQESTINQKRQLFIVLGVIIQIIVWFWCSAGRLAYIGDSLMKYVTY